MFHHGFGVFLSVIIGMDELAYTLIPLFCGIGCSHASFGLCG